MSKELATKQETEKQWEQIKSNNRPTIDDMKSYLEAKYNEIRNELNGMKRNTIEYRWKEGQWQFVSKMLWDIEHNEIPTIIKGE